MTINRFKHILLGLAAAASAPLLSAQGLMSGYFDDNYMYRFQSNAAFAPHAHFFSGVGVGNSNINVSGNIGVEDIFYTREGSCTTFMDPRVSSDEVFQSLASRPEVNLAVNQNVATIGFKGFRGFNVFSISVRGNASAGISRDLVEALKMGVENRTYDLSKCGVNGAAWGEILVGHSQNVTRNLRIGVNAKFLLGLGRVSTKINSAKINLDPNGYSAEMDAEMTASIRGLRYETAVNSRTGHTYINDVDLDHVKPVNGIGGAVDLGAVYTIGDFEISAALNDLGVIKWQDNHVASTNGLKTVQTNDYTISTSNSESLNQLKDKVCEFYEFEDMGDRGPETAAVGAYCNVGVQYTAPFYRRMKFGLLNTTRFNSSYSWSNLRASVTVEPISIFSATASVSAGSYGVHVGGLFNIKLPLVNLYVGSDFLPTRFNKQYYVPLTHNANVCAGLNFVI